MTTMLVTDGAGDAKYIDTSGAGTSGDPYTPHKINIYDKLYLAEQEILSTYSDTVSIIEKGKSLVKFGQNNDIGTTEEMVWLQGGFETLPAGNDIDIVVSDNAGDTQEVVIEGHTLSGSDLTFVVQTATLNGTTDVTLTTPLYRATRIYNNGATDFAGTVTVEDSGTSTHLSTSGTNNQSLKCATSLSSTDYWILTHMVISVDRQASRAVDFSLQVKEFGKVFRTRLTANCNSNTGSVVIPFEPCMIIKPNSDIRVTAISSGTTTGVAASLHGYLASIQV